MKGYKKRQLETFTSLGTSPDEWQICELVGIETDDKGREIPIFRAYPGYSLRRPFYDTLSKEELDALIQDHEINSESGEGWMNSCQLCGHNIMYPWKIKHDKKLFLMDIGSECITNFMNASTATVSKEFKLKVLKKEFKSWKRSAVNECWNNHKHFRHDEYGDVLTYGRENKPLIQRKYFKLQEELRQLDTDDVSYRKISGLFKKAKKLEIKIPDQVDKLIQTKKPIKTKLKRIKKLSKSRKSALDKFFWK